MSSAVVLKSRLQTKPFEINWHQFQYVVKMLVEVLNPEEIKDNSVIG